MPAQRRVDPMQAGMGKVPQIPACSRLLLCFRLDFWVRQGLVWSPCTQNASGRPVTGGGWTSSLQCTPQHFDILGDLTVLYTQFLDPAHAVHHCGVITSTETPADFRQRTTCQLLA
jgi:hypothetical protein